MVPTIMRVIRTHMRASSSSVLSVPHFRTLRYLSDHPGCPLHEVAEFIGLSVPSASKIVQSLLQRGFLHRRGDPVDRRRSVLEVSSRGQRVLDAARDETQAKLAQVLGPLTGPQRAQLRIALSTLHHIFSPDSIPSTSAKPAPSRRKANSREAQNT